jgi:hypothetical protein
MKKKGRDRGSPLRRQPMKARADRPTAGPRRRTKRRKPPMAKAVGARRIVAIRKQIAQVAAASRPPRWNADPEDVKRSVLKLVLTLVEFVRQLLERQAIRRMENGTLTDEETDSVGLALMRLQETILDLAQQFDIDPAELNLDLGPVGRLM